jgi:hypothetical protein
MMNARCHDLPLEVIERDTKPRTKAEFYSRTYRGLSREAMSAHEGSYVSPYSNFNECEAAVVKGRLPQLTDLGLSDREHWWRLGYNVTQADTCFPAKVYMNYSPSSDLLKMLTKWGEEHDLRFVIRILNRRRSYGLDDDPRRRDPVQLKVTTVLSEEAIMRLKGLLTSYPRENGSRGFTERAFLSSKVIEPQDSQIGARKILSGLYIDQERYSTRFLESLIAIIPGRCIALRRFVRELVSRYNASGFPTSAAHATVRLVTKHAKVVVAFSPQTGFSRVGALSSESFPAREAA